MNQKQIISTLYVVFMLISLAMFTSVGSVSIQDIQNIDPTVLKISQIFNVLFAFILPAVAYVWLFKHKQLKWFDLRSNLSFFHLLLTACIFISALPAISFLAEWNAELHLPSFLADIEEQLRIQESKMEAITLHLLDMKNSFDLISNVFIIGFMAALSEELFFRGMVQKHFMSLSKNPHPAIWFTAIAFSLLHGQFFGFIPRMLLGALLGYVFYYTKNLVFPILGHFLNNGIQVVMTYYYLQKYPIDQLKDITMGADSIWVPMLSVALVAIFFLWMQKSPQSTKNRIH